MKKFLLLALFSSQALAIGQEQPYIGGNFLVGDSTELDAGVASIDEGNDVGLALYAGYNFPLNKNLDFGVELEYQHIGEAEFADNISVDGNAFYLNARPKLVSAGNDFYSAFILGLGFLDGETKVLGMTASETEFSYQLGVEVGYMYHDVDFSIGYRFRTADFDGVDISIQGATIGMRYHF